MQKILLMLLCACFMQQMQAQNTIYITVRDASTGTALPAAVVSLSSTNTTITNTDGLATLTASEPGKYTLRVSHIGFNAFEQALQFPIPGRNSVEVNLQVEEEEGLDEVIVQSTRTSRSIRNTPTRVETIDGEELDEKNNMRPANISMLLHESTGLQVQQTSATSGNASIRVQGLDGRYTQLLKDGYPNFGNFAGGLSVLEIPPLDLKQVEVIKGPSSTLYGGGAIAGVVNFISKQPTDKFQADVILNQSNIGQTNIGAFIAKRNAKVGYSMLGQINNQLAYDVDKDDFSEIPKSNGFTLHPKLFIYPDSSLYVMLGNSFTRSNNTGGDIQVLDGKSDATHVYFEKNKTVRNTTTLEIGKTLGHADRLLLKQSLGIFDRHINLPAYQFSGLNTNAFTDLSYSNKMEKHTLIGGVNLVYDKFRQEETNLLNARSFTTGAYLQDTWDISNHVIMEGGLRADHVSYSNQLFSRKQTFLLPRISALFKITDKLTSRIGAGLGYKAPTIFTEQTESMQYQKLQPLNNVRSEKSKGATGDINYSSKIFEGLAFIINQMFFVTEISSPLVLQPAVGGNYFFINATQTILSQGFETNLKFIYKEDLKLFVGYTYTNAKAGYLPGNSYLTLLPKNKVNLTMMYEKEDNFKLGLEGYFTDRQYLSTGAQTSTFWEFGFMAQKTFQKTSFFINFENFTDQRQSKYKPVANGPHNDPGFDEIWNHTEGFVFNGGIKLKF